MWPRKTPSSRHDPMKTQTETTYYRHRLWKISWVACDLGRGRFRIVKHYMKRHIVGGTWILVRSIVQEGGLRKQPAELNTGLATKRVYVKRATQACVAHVPNVDVEQSPTRSGNHEPGNSTAMLGTERLTPQMRTDESNLREDLNDKP